MSDKICVMFPGQGAQYEGMSIDILESDGLDKAKEIFDKAKSILDKDTFDRLFSDIDTISRTRYSQLAIYLNSLALYQEIKDRIDVDTMIGLSLGEYTALTAAGYIDIDEGIDLVKNRGMIMQDGVKGKGSMMAIMKADLELIYKSIDCIKKENPDSLLAVANLNSKDQIVVGGDFSMLDLLEIKLREEGVKKIARLNVEGPFHTPALEESAKIFRYELDKLDIKDSGIKVYSNFDSKPHDNAHMRYRLERQMYNPVHFEECARRAYEDGCNIFVEVGAGKALSGFVKKIDKGLKIINIQNPDDICKIDDICRGGQNG